MSRITTEAEGIARMTDHFARGNMSGQYPIWTARKAAALTVAQMAPGAEIRNVLDLGIGDLSVMAAWGGFRGLSHYHGVDGTPAVISGAAEKLAQLRAAGEAPPHLVELLTFGELYAGKRPSEFGPWGRRAGPDLVIAFDVLYHVHDDATAHFLAAYPFTVPSARFVALSWGTGNHVDVDHFDRTYTFPAGWDLIHAEGSEGAGTVPQRLGVWRRVTC